MSARTPDATGPIALQGLEPAPSQTWGRIRLVPLRKRECREDLRLRSERFREPAIGAQVSGRPGEAGEYYFAYLPHAYTVEWTPDGAPVAALGAQLDPSRSSRWGKAGGKAPVLNRLVRRNLGRDRTLRFLPLHLAMEGFLGLYFNAPEIAWRQYSSRAISTGLSPRIESSIPGWASAVLADALRTFEILDDQVGVLVFNGDDLVSAFVVPHPGDYRELHASLLEDFFGEVLMSYGWLEEVAPLAPEVPLEGVASFEELRARLRRAREQLGAFKLETMCPGLLGPEMALQAIHQAGPFRLERFVSDLDPERENHIGERIVRQDGSLEYLKTFRLSQAQCRRVYLLKQLAEAGWSVSTLAARLGTTFEELIYRFDKAGWGYLFQDGVLENARQHVRRPKR